MPKVPKYPRPKYPRLKQRYQLNNQKRLIVKSTQNTSLLGYFGTLSILASGILGLGILGLGILGLGILSLGILSCHPPKEMPNETEKLLQKQPILIFAL